MVLKVQIVDNFEEYLEKVQKHQDDPLMNPEKPDMDITYANYVIADKYVDGFRYSRNKETGNKELFIFTSLPDMEALVVDYTKEVEEVLTEIIDIKNKKFRQ